jgi:hypothetical protein
MGAWSFRLTASVRNGSGIGGRPGTIEFGIGSEVPALSLEFGIVSVSVRPTSTRELESVTAGSPNG